MGSTTEASNAQKVRGKSTAYPPVSIFECDSFIRKIDSLGGGAVSYASVLDLLGLKSPSTKSFSWRVSASKQFGLIKTSGGVIQLTDLGKKSFHSLVENYLSLC